LVTGLSTASAVRATGAASDAALPRITLVLGGARSGKSRYAEALIGERPAVYIATATAGDDEMAARIRVHRTRRSTNWTTREAPLELAAALAADDERPRLVDCLTLWLSNLMLAGRDPAAETAALIQDLPRVNAPLVFVANEVGLGLVPENELGRRFRDHAGRLNQDLAAVADRVVFVAAGLPLTLKDSSR